MTQVNELEVKVGAKLKGGRKVGQDKYNGVLMVIGLLIIIVGCWLESTLVSIAVGLLAVFSGGVLGKAHSFNWSNSKEHISPNKGGSGS